MAPKAKKNTTDKWRDSLGQEFRPGDLIAVATINGKSPQMVVAEVLYINTHNSKGEPHSKSVRTGKFETIERENKKYIGPALPEPPVFDRTMSYNRADVVKREDAWGEYHQKRKALQEDPNNWLIMAPTIFHREINETVPTVTVSARPLLDGRGFYRTGTRRPGNVPPEEYMPAEAKPVTYMLIGNIIKLSDTLTKEEVLAISQRPVEFPPSGGW